MWGVQRKPSFEMGQGPKPSPDVPVMASPAAMITDQQAEPEAEMDPMRKRLAEAILSATQQPEGQEILHPMQALGNAANQISAAYLKRKLSPNG